MTTDDELVQLAESGQLRVKGKVLSGVAAAELGQRELMNATGATDVDEAVAIALEGHSQQR